MRQREAYAYTAGIVDGEGCITISYGNQLTNGRRLSLEVTVTNTKEWLCQWLKMQYGGAIKLHSKADIRHLDCWRWRVCAQKAKTFLELILPYLQLKRPQAEIAIGFQSRKRYWGKVGKDHSTVLIEEAERILIQSYNSKQEKGKPPSVRECKKLLEVTA